jgi:hypothetical protein
LPKCITCSNTCSKKYRYLGWRIRNEKKNSGILK